MKILLKFDNNIKITDFKFVYNFINKNREIGINNYKLKDLMSCIENLMNDIPQSKDTYIKILKEELKYNLNNDFGCPKNNIDIILINIIPFIKYPFNISSEFIIGLEIKYLIKKILKNNNLNNYKKYIINKLWEIYHEKIIPIDYVGILTNKIFYENKFKNNLL